MCGAGPVKIRVTLERKGYVPGQYVAVQGEIRNESSKPLSRYRIELLQVNTNNINHVNCNTVILQ